MKGSAPYHGAPPGQNFVIGGPADETPGGDGDLGPSRAITATRPGSGSFLPLGLFLVYLPPMLNRVFAAVAVAATTALLALTTAEASSRCSTHGYRIFGRAHVSCSAAKVVVRAYDDGNRLRNGWSCEKSPGQTGVCQRNLPKYGRFVFR